LSIPPKSKVPKGSSSKPTFKYGTAEESSKKGHTWKQTFLVIIEMSISHEHSYLKIGHFTLASHYFTKWTRKEEQSERDQIHQQEGIIATRESKDKRMKTRSHDQREKTNKTRQGRE
jgi:hypothetical protein